MSLSVCSYFYLCVIEFVLHQYDERTDGFGTIFVAQTLRAQFALAGRVDFSAFDQWLTLVEPLPPAEKQPQIAEVQTYFMFVQQKYPGVVRVAESTDDQLLADSKRCLWVKYTLMGLAKRRLSDEPGGAQRAIEGKIGRRRRD